jgi:hypothetical protein
VHIQFSSFRYHVSSSASHFTVRIFPSSRRISSSRLSTLVRCDALVSPKKLQDQRFRRFTDYR